MRRHLLNSASALAVYWPPKLFRVRVTREAVEQAFLLSWVRLLLSSAYTLPQMAARLRISLKRAQRMVERPTFRAMGLLCYAAGVEPNIQLRET